MARKQHWAQINEFSWLSGIRLLFWIYRLFGRGVFRLVLYPVVFCYFISMAAARAASRDYLRHLNAFAPELRLRPNLRTVLRHFLAFAESLLDKILLWGGFFDLAGVEEIGREAILQCRTSGRGGLLICAHLGNLELCRVLAQQRSGLKLTVLIHTKHAQAFNRLLAQLDPNSQLNLLQVTEMSPAMAMQLAEKVAQGEFIVIAGDRIPVTSNQRVAFVPFLGQSAPFPIGPYVLASVLQCPVYLVFSARTERGAKLYFEPFCEKISLPRKSRETALTTLAGDYAARLQYYCLQTPLQWFNFYDFWHMPAVDKVE